MAEELTSFGAKIPVDLKDTIDQQGRETKIPIGLVLLRLAEFWANMDTEDQKMFCYGVSSATLEGHIQQSCKRFFYSEEGQAALLAAFSESFRSRQVASEAVAPIADKLKNYTAKEFDNAIDHAHVYMLLHNALIAGVPEKALTHAIYDKDSNPSYDEVLGAILNLTEVAAATRYVSSFTDQSGESEFHDGADQIADEALSDSEGETQAPGGM